LIEVFVQQAKADVKFGRKLSVKFLGHDDRIAGRGWGRFGISASSSCPDEQTSQICQDPQKTPEIQIPKEPFVVKGVVDDAET
jgi:hypothetical protein